MCGSGASVVVSDDGEVLGGRRDSGPPWGLEGWEHTLGPGVGGMYEARLALRTQNQNNHELVG